MNAGTSATPTTGKGRIFDYCLGRLPRIHANLIVKIINGFLFGLLYLLLGLILSSII
jgi:hypothetical protein